MTDIDFNNWMRQVDQVFEDFIGLESSDLEDYHWHDTFDDGVDPKEAVQMFLEENGYTSQYPELWLS